MSGRPQRVAILFDTAGFVRTLPLTGAAARTLFLNKHLARQGVDVRLFLCDLNAESQPSTAWPFATSYLDYSAFYSDPQKLVPELKDFAPDVLVMANSQLTAEYGRGLADSVGAALVYEMHDDEGSLLRSIHRPEDECREAAFAQSRAIAAADGVVALTDEDAQVARAMTRMPVHVVPCGVEPGPQPLPASSRTLAFVGNLYYEPNRRAVEYLRSDPFAGRLRATGAAVEVYGRYPAELRGQDHQEADFVRLRGPVPHLRDAVASSIVGLAPLDSGGGMKLKVLEYIGAGVAVVGTTIAASGFEWFERFGLIAMDDLTDFPDRVEQLLTDDALRHRLGAEGRLLAETWYSWDRMATLARRAYLDIRDAAALTVVTPLTLALRAVEPPYWLREWTGRQGTGETEPLPLLDETDDMDGVSQLAEAVDCARLAAQSRTGVSFPRTGSAGYKGRSVAFFADDAVLKVYTHRGEDRCSRELAGLTYAGDRCPDLNIPAPIASASLQGSLSWIVTRRITGGPVATWDRALAVDLGRLAARLHAEAPGSSPFRRSPSVRAAQSTHDAVYRSLLDKYHQSKETAECHVGFVHGDFSSRNILIAGGRISGIVDFERSGTGCRYHDLVSVYLHDGLMMNLPWRDFLAAYTAESCVTLSHEHLEHHLAEYFCWILEWAPVVDPQLASSVGALALRFLERGAR
ncbi:phosphotransferase [Nonomuraea rhodomycinica]|uniref:Phosphotransferase n=1 Tax=Nonomuraea rhodomycinica TaxID=1712872 RepID=A0A7Y6M8M3_9ACTN|nr:phosphotransferase [Nonomuraea rhodomycinica]NUW38687.1 phosphotransferase [Nonomuraea rhodomycinica]